MYVLKIVMRIFSNPKQVYVFKAKNIQCLCFFVRNFIKMNKGLTDEKRDTMDAVSRLFYLLNSKETQSYLPLHKKKL